MASAGLNEEGVLRNRIGRFLESTIGNGGPLAHTVRDLLAHGGSAYLFGGAIRDLMVFGGAATPRDFDVVVGEVSVGRLRDVLADRVKRQTRFGGVHLDVGGWLLDVWPLRETWAFREGIMEFNGFRDLPKTTFLNVEAVVAELIPRPGRPRRIYAKGFFEAIRSRTIEINLEENPSPDLCVVRSLITAANLGFAIGPRLVRYIAHYGREIPVEQLLAIQLSHYGSVRCSREVLSVWLSAVEDHVQTFRQSSLQLPMPDSRQLGQRNDYCKAD